MKFEQLKKELDSNIFRRVYIFTGPEKGVLSKYVRRLGVEDIHQNLSDVLPLIKGKSLFQSATVFAVREGFEEYEYSKLLELCGSKYRLILLPETVDSRKKLYRDAIDVVVEFNHFTSEQLEYYVRSKFEEGTMSDYACRLIAARCNNDVCTIDNACEKLSSFGGDINEEIICDLISPLPEDRIFELADAVIFDKSVLVFQIVDELYQLRMAELQMIVFIYNHFKAVMQIQYYSNKNDFELSKLTGLSPWIVSKKRQESVGVRSVEYYLTALQTLYSVEQDIKMGRTPPEAGFINLLYLLLKK